MKLERFNPLLKFWNKYEYFTFFALVPLTLFFIYLIPHEIKQIYFILFPKDPNIFSMLLNNYAHSEISHLAGNLSAHLTIFFLLFNVEVHRKLFHRMALLIFIILPIILSLFDIFIAKIIPNALPTLGFSGIVAGWVGYFTYSIYNRMRKLHKIPLNRNFLFSIFLINAAIVALFHEELLLALVSLISSIIFIYLNKKGFLAIVRVLISGFRTKDGGWSTRLYSHIIFLLSIFFLFSLCVLIPRNPRIDSAIVNTTVHYIGYIFGMFAPLGVEYFC